VTANAIRRDALTAVRKLSAVFGFVTLHATT
jgi:hypothetical protein